VSSNNTCKECGKAIAAESPGGFCAQCLLSLGLGPVAKPSAQIEEGGLHKAAGPGENWSKFQAQLQTGLSKSTILAADPLTEKAGDRIGRYRLLQEIGQGGCGVVYMAEQEEPVHRRVALKVIKLGMDTKQVVARFEAERQALAMMDHPNIAKVLDAGATDAGRPYFVMELVRGIRITDYCDQNKLPTRERLKLFTQVCQAIQHAHQKGIIHRDIKPSNILVTLHDGVPVPKVIDFGIAKATQGKLTDQTLFTAFEQFIGTPAYMSPEQVEMSGLDIDTRSDIYSLGVLLYELLVGATPFAAAELLAAGVDQMRRVIREKDPVRPSTRLSTMLEGELTTTAKHRQTDAPKLIHLVRGDLDWIVMKCLEKDRTRRYETATGLARDIERHLGNEPVMARPPSSAYRFQKFVRRNKVVVTAAAMIAAVLVLGILASTWQAVEATRAKREQIRLRAQAQAEERATRLRAYASEVGVALQAWEAGNPSHARNLLERQHPKNGEEDLRGFEWRYLYGLFRPRAVATLRLQSGGDEVWGSAWSPDGQYVAMGTLWNSRVEVWDFLSRKFVQSTPAEPAVRTKGAIYTKGAVYTFAFSPDGRKLAYPIEIDTGDPSKHELGVALWDLHTRQVVEHFTRVDSDANPFLALSHSGRLLAYVNVHGYRIDITNKIVICDLTRENVPFELTGHDAAVVCPEFSPDDKYLITPCADGTIVLWNLESRSIVDRLIGHRGMVTFAKFSPDGEILATGGSDRTVRLWDLHRAPRRSTILGNHGSSVFGLNFSPNGKLLISASLDHTAKVWDVAAQKEIQTLRGHDQRVFSASFSPDGRLIMTGSEEGTVKIWLTPEAPDDEPLDSHSSPDWNTVLEFSPDSRWLVELGGGQSKLWNVAARRSTILDLPRFQFSPNSNTLAGFTASGKLELWDISGQSPRRLAVSTNNPAFRSDAGLSFAPDGRFLAVVLTNGGLTIWSLAGETPQLVHTLASIAAPETSAGFSPDGRVLAILSMTNTLAVWNWKEERLLISLQEPVAPKAIEFYAFSPNSKTLLTRYKDGSVRIWETAQWTPGELITNTASYWPHGFSSDSRFVAFAGYLNIGLWDVVNHTFTELRSGSGPVGPVCFSPDARSLAAGTRDGWVNLWNLASRQQIIPIKAHQSVVSGAAFSPDGRTLATAGVDGKLRLWTAPTLAETDAKQIEQP
jgi:WD40 repeat protein/serine/threonine protein kinase